MKLDEAMTAASKGAKVKRASWRHTAAIQESTVILFSEGGSHRRVRMLCTTYGNPAGAYNTPAGLSDEDLAADDWQVAP